MTKSLVGQLKLVTVKSKPQDRHITVREIARRLNVLHATIENDLKCLGVVKELDIWVADYLKKIHLTQRVNISNVRQRNQQNVDTEIDHGPSVIKR